MPAYNFNPRFVPFIQDGTKVHTIRAEGKRKSPKVGDRLRLYTGMRTKTCTLIMDWTPCVGVQPILIIYGLSHLNRGVFLDGKELSEGEAVLLMWRDGFRRDLDWPDPARFWDWFCKGLKPGEGFRGHLISWAPHPLLPG